MFEFLNTVLLKAARSLSCQDNHGNCIGYYREIQPFFSFLEDVGLGQYNVSYIANAHTVYVLLRKRGVEIGPTHSVSASWKSSVHIWLRHCSLPDAKRDCHGSTPPLIRLGRRRIHLPGQSCNLKKK